MKEAKKAKVPLRKIIGMCLILLFVMGIGVMASNTKVNNVKIILANGYEMNVVTTKTNVADILKENHIILLPEENSIPNADKTLSDNNTIRITKISDDDNQSQKEIADTKETSSNVTADNLLKSYDSIVEKIETVQETIPFETVTKDVSDGSDTKTNNVIQEGKNGLKEIKYKVKYQNDIEVERNEISSTVIQEPVDKVVEVRKQATSRSLTTSRSSATYGSGTWTYGASDFDLLCAITAQESSSGYDGALAVISCACNRAQRNGSDPLTQYKARGQFCYSIDSNWKNKLNGNYASFVSQAVKDALNGKRNHNYTSFRSAGYASGEYIGGNVYF